MSVILDALRRGRGGAPASPPRSGRPPLASSSLAMGTMRPVPAGLRVGGGSRRRAGGSKSIVTGVALVAVVGAAAYGALRVSQNFFGKRPPAVRSSIPYAPPPAAPTKADPPAAKPGDAAKQVDAHKAIAGTLGVTMPRPHGEPLPPPSQSLKPARPAGPQREARPTETAVGRLPPSGPGAVSVPRSEPGVVPPVAPRPEPALTAATVAPPTSTVSPSPAVDHFALAVRYQSVGDFEQALRHYLAVLDADAFNVEARNNLGLLYHDRGLVDDSVEQFRKAISINPQYLKARSNLAVVLMDAGRLAEARAELRAALQLDPRNVDLLVNMALVEKSDRQPDAAIETLLRALGYQPSHALAHYNLALLYEEKGEVGRAYDQYAAYLQNAGPEQGTLLSDVRRRIDAIRGQANPATR